MQCLCGGFNCIAFILFALYMVGALRDVLGSARTTAFTGNVTKFPSTTTQTFLKRILVYGQAACAHGTLRCIGIVLTPVEVTFLTSMSEFGKRLRLL